MMKPSVSRILLSFCMIMFSFTISDQSSDVSNMVSQTTISPQVSQDPGRKTSSRRRSEDNPEMMRHRVFVNRAHMQLTLDLMSSLMIDNFLPEKKLLETFAFSPLSLQSTLMMMHLGSRGITRKEISDALYLSRMTDYLRSTLTDDNSTNLSVTKAHEIYGDSVMSLLNDVSLNKILRIANQMFVQRDLIPNSSFENMLKQYHSSRLKPVDFTTNPRTLINDWISKESDELINEFLSAPPSPTSLLMAINVVTFQGEWVYRFNSMDTEHDARFRRTNGELSRISMMVGKLPVAYTYNEQLNTTVIELPYKTARLGLFLLLPDEATGIFQLMRSLNESTFTQLISSMRKDTKEGVNIRLPKFIINSTPRMTKILSNSLRIRSLFSPGEADLSGMFLNLPYSGHVDDFLHKVVMKVDEKGTLGAAASATVVERVGTFTGQYFEADHPFMFFLTDKQSGLILFAGVFAGPQDLLTHTLV